MKSIKKGFKGISLGWKKKKKKAVQGADAEGAHSQPFELRYPASEAAGSELAGSELQFFDVLVKAKVPATAACGDCTIN